MALTYYDMEKLMRMVYNQKLSDSLKKIAIRRRRTWDRATPCTGVPCRIRPSEATAE
jgi:hypothetical protein